MSDDCPLELPDDPRGEVCVHGVLAEEQDLALPGHHGGGAVVGRHLDHVDRLEAGHLLGLGRLGRPPVLGLIPVLAPARGAGEVDGAVLAEEERVRALVADGDAGDARAAGEGEFRPRTG